ncbi:MAG: tetratricopeptide repeat protein [Candidatus Omnitrophota bacterium]
MLKFCVLVIVGNLVFVAYSTCFAANQARKNVKEANKLYQQGKLDEALQKYNDASVAIPDSDIVNFDMGAALYKKEDYQKAIGAFTKALVSDNKKIEADALYNLGNCKYKLGKLKENTDLSATVGLLRESLDYCKRAVELDQKNKDARFNHEFVEKELKVLVDKLKKQESNPDKQKNQQKEKQDQQKKSASSDKEQSKEEKEKSGQTQDQEQQEKEQSEQAQAQQQQDKEKQGQGQSQQEENQEQKEKEQAAKEEPQQDGDAKELSEESARALLERYGKEEAKPDYMDKQAQQGYDRQVIKDW